MATYFVFGNAPTVDDLHEFVGIDETSDDLIKIEDAEDRSGHYIMNINGHLVGAQTDYDNYITAVYAIDSDNEGVRLLTILIEQWSEENSEYEKDIATTVIDDEMSIYLDYIHKN
jgi:hypothetical protein